MNRRRFLSLLGLAAATAAIDPERLLWTPGERTHILPPSQGWRATDVDQYGNISFAFHPDAFKFCVEDLPEPARTLTKADIAAAAKRLADHIDREAVRLYYDVANPVARIDVLYGFKMLQPTKVGRIVSTEAMPKDEILLASGAHAYVIKGVA